MLKLYSNVLLALLIAGAANAQLNLSLVGQLDYESEFNGQRGDCSDIWGYVDPNGHEYAIVGNQNGTSIVDISTDPTNPTEVFFSPGATTIWRDMKVYGTTAYITNEGGNGLKIIDLSNLPGPITNNDVYQFTGTNFPFSTAHNIFIDVPAGRAYITGADWSEGGAIILDLTQDQLNPVELGAYDDYYMHDIYVRNDTLWGGAINDGFFTVVDVSNPANCTTMATQITPSTFSHNVWLSDDGNTLYTTDEVEDAYIAAYDVSDLNNIVETDRIQSSPGQDVIPHNVFVHNQDFLVTSYYRDGVTIHDCSNPNNLVEVGFYDTSPAFSGGGFNGCWGVYPYLPSGYIIASDIENGCFVLNPTYTAASFLEGNITDASNSNPINNATIDITAANVVDNSDLSGDYLSGVATAGTYDVTYSKLGYVSQTITGVTLTSGQTTIQDVALVPQITFTLEGVVEDPNGTPIPNAQVVISNSQQTLTTTTNGLGEFEFQGFLSDVYDVTIGVWGHHTICLTGQLLDSNGGPYTYVLEQGYSDYFDLDLGWTVSGNAQTGDWERGIPDGTTYLGAQSNPDVDSDDCGDMAFVTGNGGGQAGSDDIDDGETVLTSPMMDLSTYQDPYLSFERWFFNGGGQGGAPNDSIVIELSNGTQSAVLDFAIFNDPQLSEWAYREVRVTDYVPLTAFMQVKVRAMDQGSGHLAEGGFDNFFVRDSIIDVTNVSELPKNEFTVYPNPFTEEINIRWNENYENVVVTLIEPATGRIVLREALSENNQLKLQNSLSKGIYMLQLTSNEQVIATQRVVKM
ncbi:MAG: choice-of-anchor B family protein [bacterium]|nr:choice-of-anchor B family protein [bacterium]